MNYAQCMKWQRKHPKGGKAQYMGMACGSGFWPSGAWLKQTYWPYLERCKAAGVTPREAEDVYHNGLSPNKALDDKEKEQK